MVHRAAGNTEAQVTSERCQHEVTLVGQVMGGSEVFFSRLGTVRAAEGMVSRPRWILASGPLWWTGPPGPQPYCPCY